jgi:hypothetical protein
MRIATAILVFVCGCNPNTSPLSQQLREASEYVPCQANTDALIAIREAIESTPEPPATNIENSPSPPLDVPAQVDSVEPIPEPTIEYSQPMQSVGPLLTLYTTDGSFPCGGCVAQERILSAANVSVDDYQVVKVNADVAASMGGVPIWEPYDKSRRYPGTKSAAQLSAWIDALREHSMESITCDARVLNAPMSLDTIAAALAIHLSEEAGQQPFGALLNVDIDTPDDATRAVFDVLRTGKWTSESAGVVIDWSSESRSIIERDDQMRLIPPPQVKLKKWVARWAAAIVSIDYDTTSQEITLVLSGAPDLNVRFR